MSIEHNPLKSVPQSKKEEYSPSIVPGQEYAEKVVNYFSERSNLLKKIEEDGEFLAVVGTEGHTNGPEKDAETMRFLGAQLRRHKEQLKDLEDRNRAGKNLETEEEKKHKKAA